MTHRSPAGTVALAIALAAAPWLLGAGGAAEGDDLSPGADVGAVVVLVLFVGAAYLLADFVVDRLQRRFLVLSGIEYLALGGVIGPAFLGGASPEAMRPLIPFAGLAVGWFGLLRGLDTDLRRLEQRRSGALRIAFVQAAVVGAAVGGTAWSVLRPGVLAGSDTTTAIAAAVVLASCAVASSSQPLELLRRRYDVGNRLAPVVQRVSELSEILAIFASGLVTCFLHPGGETRLSETEWAVVTVALGGVLGLLFRPFVGEEQSESRRFLALVGIITFASGAAVFLRLSPLLVNLVLGGVLVLSPRGRAGVRRTLERTEAPMNLMLLVLAGALWRPPSLPGRGPLDVTAVAAGGVLAFALLRWLGKLVGDRLAVAGTKLPGNLHRGLLGQGSFTIAMAVLLRAYYAGPAIDWAYTIVLGSFALHSPIATRAARGLFVDAGDIRRDVTRPSTRPSARPSAP